MKNLSMIIFFFLIIIPLLSTSYVVAPGTTSSPYSPFSIAYEYGWSRMFYTATDLAEAGLTRPADIIALGFDVNYCNDNIIRTNQSIYMKHTQSTLDTSYPGTSGYTSVFSGTVRAHETGWITIILDAPFAWNGSDNIEILWENHSGASINISFGFSAEYLPYNAYQSSYKRQNGSFPTSAGSSHQALPTVKMFTSIDAIPDIPAFEYPEDGKLAVPDPMMLWHSQGENPPTSWDVYFGTTNPPAFSHNQTNDFYQPSCVAGQEYFWQIVPQNAHGSPSGSPIMSFTIPDESMNFVGFEDTTFPPAGWIFNGNVTRQYHSFNPFLNGNYYAHAYSPSYLVSPKVTVSQGAAFDFSLMGLPSNEVDLLISSNAIDWTDSGLSFSTTEDLVWTQAHVVLSDFLSPGDYYLRLNVDNQEYTYCRLDNIFYPEIAPSPPAPAANLAPEVGETIFGLGSETLSWEPTAGLVESYDIYFGTENPPPFLVNQTAASYTCTDLAANQTYYWKVLPRNEYGVAEDCPVWLFHTPSATQIQEGFESTTFPPAGWNFSGTFNRAYFTNIEGSYCAQLQALPSNTGIMTTPRVEITENSVFDFMAHKQNSSTPAMLQVQYSLDGSQWDVLGEFEDFNSSAYNPTRIQVDLSSIFDPGTQLFLMIKGIPTGTSTTSFYIDRIIGPEVVGGVPGAPSIIGPADRGWLLTNETLRWTSLAGVTDSYDVYFGTTDPPPFIQNQTGTSYLPTVEAGEQYYWKVVPRNSEGELLNCPVYSVRTPTASQLAESFENYPPFPPDGWINQSAFQIWSNPSYAYHGAFITAIRNNTGILITPKLDITATTEFEFYAKNHTPGGEKSIQLKWTVNGSDWYPLGDEIDISYQYEWKRFTFDLAEAAQSHDACYVGIEVDPDYNCGYVMLDHIVGPERVMDPVPEPAVRMFPQENGWMFTDESLEWKSLINVCTSYDVYFGTDNPPPFIQNQTETSFSPTLDAGETYYWKIVPYNENGPAEDCPIWTFGTPSENQLAERFDDSTYPDGWGNLGDYLISNTSYPESGYSVAVVSASIPLSIVAPRLSFDAASNLELYNKSYLESPDHRIQVKYSADGLNWANVGAEIQLPSGTDWQGHCIDLQSLDGQTGFLAIEHYSVGDVGGNYIDHIVGPELDDGAPAVAHRFFPADGGYAFIDDVLSWEPVAGIVDSYDVYFGTTDPPPFVQNQIETSFDPDLSYGQEYFWKIVPKNTSGEAQNCPIKSFTTVSEGALTEDFESTTFPPPGWASSGSASRVTYSSYVIHGIASGGLNSNQNGMIISPKVLIEEDSSFDFYLYSNDYTSSQKLLICYSDDMTTWHTLGDTIHVEWSVNSKNPHHMNFALGSLADSMPGIYLAFKTQAAIQTAYTIFDHIALPNPFPIIPGVSTLQLPSDMATEINELATFSWSVATGGGIPETYKLYCDTSPDPSTLIATTEELSWTMSEPLDYGVTYYWKVVACNIAGEGEDSAIRSFTVREDPTITSYPWTEDFDTSSSDFPPTNWTMHSGVLGNPTVLGQDPSGDWASRAWLNSVNENFYSAYACMYRDTNGWLISPPLQIDSGDYRISFDMAVDIEGNPFDDTCVFAVLVGDGISWSTANVVRRWDNQGSPYKFSDITNSPQSVYLPMGEPGTKRIALYFESANDPTNIYLRNKLFVDNLTVMENPSVSQTYVWPDELDLGFGLYAQPTPVQTVTLTNTGGVTLDIAAEQVSFTGLSASQFQLVTGTLPVSLEPCQSVDLEIRLNSTQAGVKTATLQVAIPSETIEIPLTGEGLEYGFSRVGSGTDWDDINPINCYRNFNLHECIYYPSEIQIANKQIEKISYYWNGGLNADDSDEWTIYMGYTDMDAFELYNEWVSSDSLTQVFTGEVTLPAQEGWIEITLDQPFLYNNQDNLMICLHEHAEGHDYAGGGFQTSESRTRRSVHYGRDYEIDPANDISGDDYYWSYPNIRFEFESPTCDTIEPEISHFPVLNTPVTDQPYTVYATIVDDAEWNSGIAQATLMYRTNESGFTAVPMTLVRDGYIAEIPAQALGTVVEYLIEAIDASPQANMTITDTYRFEISDPFDLFYFTETNPNYIGSGTVEWGAASIFGNPLYDTGVALKLNAVEGASYYPTSGYLKLYEMDSEGTLTSITSPIPITFNQGTVPQSFPLESIQITSPYLMVMFQLPAVNYFPMDRSVYYPNNNYFYNASSGTLYELGVIGYEGVWKTTVTAETGEALVLEAPVACIQRMGDDVLLSWEQVINANSYCIYATEQPAISGTWTLSGQTESMEYLFSGLAERMFFKVTASSASLGNRYRDTGLRKAHFLPSLNTREALQTSNRNNENPGIQELIIGRSKLKKSTR